MPEYINKAQANSSITRFRKTKRSISLDDLFDLVVSSFSLGCLVGVLLTIICLKNA